MHVRFEEALKEMRQGSICYREQWPTTDYCFKDNHLQVKLHSGGWTVIGPIPQQMLSESWAVQSQPDYTIQQAIFFAYAGTPMQLKTEPKVLFLRILHAVGGVLHYGNSPYPVFSEEELTSRWIQA